MTKQSYATSPSREATDKMCVAGASVIQQHIATNGIENDLKAAADIWRAMVACMPCASEQINALAPTATRRGAELGQPAIGAPSARSDKKKNEDWAALLELVRYGDFPTEVDEAVDKILAALASVLSDKSNADHTALVHQIFERSKFFESNGKCFLCAPET